MEGWCGVVWIFTNFTVFGCAIETQIVPLLYFVRD